MLLLTACNLLVLFRLFPYKFVVFFKVLTRHYLNLAGDGWSDLPWCRSSSSCGGRARDQHLSRMLWTFTACCLVLFWICCGVVVTWWCGGRRISCWVLLWVVLLSKLKGAGGAECRSIYRQWLWSLLGPSGVHGSTGGATPTKIYRSTHHQCIIWLLNVARLGTYIWMWHLLLHFSRIYFICHFLMKPMLSFRSCRLFFRICG